MSSNSTPATYSNVVFFDGVCGVCNSSVDFLLRRDKRKVLKYSPIQGELAKGVLPEERRADVDTIVYLRDGELFLRTTALLKIARDVGGVLKPLYVFIVVPSSWRDWAYDVFAKNRYRWFGKKEACRIPTPQERALFID